MARRTIHAIILAAGRGSRMGGSAQGLPKCLAVVLGDKTLLETQLEALRRCGISDIAIVRGYRAEAIDVPGVRYFMNERYATTNMLESLVCARAMLDADTVVSYGDIWYEPRVVEGLLACDQDVAIAVDGDWRHQYVGRTTHPIDEAEAVVMDDHRQLVRIGKIAREDPDVNGEFVGLMKLSRRGCQLLLAHYDRARSLYDGRPFQRATHFAQAYLTDLLQELSQQGVAVHCEPVRGAWREFDTPEDLARGRQWVEQRGADRVGAPSRRD